MAALKRIHGEDIRFTGVGGPLMQAEGLKSLFPMQELSLMGLAEVLPHLPNLMKRLSQLESYLRETSPHMLVTIDSPGFAFKLAERVQDMANLKRVHYVAPSVWAYKPERAKKVARLFHHVLCLLPFEPPYFEKEGMEATFTGHPIVEQTALQEGKGSTFRQMHDISSTTPVLCMLPGSRRGEVERLLPIFHKTAMKLRVPLPELAVTLPIPEYLAGTIRSETAQWPFKTVIVTGGEMKAHALAASNIALSKSGTVTLELAMARLPMVVAYRMNPATAAIARRVVKIPSVSLVNLLLDRQVIPEFLQEKCTPSNLFHSLHYLMEHESQRMQQVADSITALQKLGLGASHLPSEKAAQVITRMLYQTS
jgi:lipid-A-disaccharide synthase